MATIKQGIAVPAEIRAQWEALPKSERPPMTRFGPFIDWVAGQRGDTTPESNGGGSAAARSADGGGALHSRPVGGIVSALVPVRWIEGPYRFQTGPRAGEVANPRTHYPPERRASLLASLRAGGQLDAVKLHVPADAPHPDAWTEADHPLLQVVDGHTRFELAAEAGIDVLRAEVRTYADSEARRVMRVTGTERENLSPMDRIRADAVEWEIAREEGRRQADVAAALGYDSQSTFSNAIGLLRLPASAQALIDDGTLGPSHARDYLVPFAGLPAELRDPLFDALVDRLRSAAEDPELPLTRRRVQELVGAVAAALSVPATRAAAAAGEAQPLFTLEEHDAACACGRPEFRYYPHLPAGPRCFNRAWATAANQGKREAAAARAAQALEDARRPQAAVAVDLDAAPSAVSGGERLGPPALVPSSSGERPDTVGHAAEGTEIQEVFDSPAVRSLEGTVVARLEALPAPEPHHPGRVLDAPASSWQPLGVVDPAGGITLASSPIAGHVLVSEGVAPAHLRYSQAAAPGSLAVWCADRAAADQAGARSGALMAEALDRARADFADRLRRDAFTFDLQTPEAETALAMVPMRTSPAWILEVMGALGMAVPAERSADAVRAALLALPKGERRLLLQAAAFLCHTNDVQRPWERERTAREAAVREVSARAREALAALIEACPPVRSPDDAAHSLYARLLAAEKRVQAALRPPLAAGDEIPLALSALRQAHAAARAWLEEGGAQPAGLDMEAAVVRVADFLREHPGSLDLMDLSERLDARAASVLLTTAAGMEAVRGRDRRGAEAAAAKVAELLGAADGYVAEGAKPSAEQAKALDDGRAFVEYLRGEGATLFGEVAPVEGAGPREDADAAAAREVAERLRAALVGAVARADNLFLDEADARKARSVVRQRHDEVRAFRLANELPDGVAELLDEAMERAAGMLDVEVEA